MAIYNPIQEYFLRESFPSPLPDTSLVKAYAAEGEHSGPLIYLSLGETWRQIPEALRKLTAALTAPEVHGYLLSPFGYPTFRETLSQYIRATHRVADFDFATGATSLGTRSAMRDFGLWLSRRQMGPAPTAVAAVPSWDYPGVFAPLGFSFAPVPLDAEQGFVPRAEDFKRAIAKARTEGTFALLILNAQHNPTAVNWSDEVVRASIREAISDRAAILLDDAYYGVHDPELIPTSALRILLEELSYLPTLQRETYPWLAVRSLGKQFHCNGWGIGAVSGALAVLLELQKIFFEHAYPYGSPLQHVMNEWLTAPESKTYLANLGAQYSQKRKYLREFFRGRLGYPDERLPVGECTSYALVAVPRAYQRGTDADRIFRSELLMKTGVLLGDESLGVMAASPRWRHVRIYLGPELAVLEEALARWERAQIFF